MKFKISYFYKIRFFKPWQIPVSTAVFDPKWYHKDSYNNNVIFKDKNGVYNGIRYPRLSAHFCGADNDCRGKGGIGKLCEGDPTSCLFLRKYREYLKYVNFQDINDNLEKLANTIKEKEGFSEEPEIVLIVHEAPDNQCSERVELVRLFKNNNINIEEF